ncbi:helix-turn-helix transcriptional regulator [Clostridium sp. YIM B02569]|uniref:helix-turn-helix domain-containing protein n=1 Tax=Clostridium sp. YIM B02569 TaxID=2911967 RepID=UPI001EE9E237|nr:helix-turn-helix transcriptional regulator [Clostridium sp. YIM B02569]
MIKDLIYANDNIKLLLKYKNWTQLTLSKKTGMTSVTLQRRLNSKIPKWTMLEASSIAKAFGLSVEEIFFNPMVPKCNKEEKNTIN